MGDEDDGDRGSDDVAIDRRTARELVTAIRGTAETNRVIAQLEERLSAARDEVAKLRRVLFEGNGHSIMVRLSNVERDVAGRTEAVSVDRRGRWDVRVAIVSALASLGVAVAALLK